MQYGELLTRVQNAEAIISELRRGLVSGHAMHDGQPLGSGNRPSITLSADGKIAIGQNGLDIEYRGSDRCPYGRSATRRKQNIAAIIVHHTSPRHTTDWYVQYQIDGDASRGGHFGYHFYIAPDGRIIQGAPLTKRTNHVKPSHRSQRRDFGRHANNRNAIGITCSGAGKPVFQPTSEQLESLRALTWALCQEFSIEFSKIYGHGEVQTDRHRTEGRSAAVEMRDWTNSDGPTGDGTPLGAESFADDELDDSPIHEVDPADCATGNGGLTDLALTPTDYDHPFEDDDDEDAEALVAELPLGVAQAPLTAAATTLQYVNQNAIRNRKCTANIERLLIATVAAVYGSGCTVNIYSGGQDRRGHGNRRTGSIRHDDYGQGGRAADVHVFDQNGRQIQGLELARLGQYWLAERNGGVGHEMRGGGIHLDEWTTPPSGGGMYWTYAHSRNKPWGTEARRMLERGARGEYP